MDSFPLQLEISFTKVFDQYRDRLSSDNRFVKERATAILEIAEKYPELSTGISDLESLASYQEQIDLILEDVFSSILETNEIKVATLPYNGLIFKSSKRYKKIVEAAGNDFEAKLNSFDEDDLFKLGCILITNFYYGFQADFRRPMNYKIPDANGIMRTYRLMYNADFVNIKKTAAAPEFTKKDFDDLLDNFDDLSLWKEKFPPNGYVFSGFVIANMFDVTADATIADFKALLLDKTEHSGLVDGHFETVFKSLFDSQDLQIGFSTFNEEDETLEQVLFNQVKSFLLKGKEQLKCTDALCQLSYQALFKRNEYFTVANASKYHKKFPENVLYKKLVDQGMESAIFAPIVDKGHVLGIMELVSPTVNMLNSINANKLKDIMPYLNAYVVQSKAKLEGELELIIQEECTSIHSSVHWKFKQEARRYFKAATNGTSALFREAVFENVYPLFGQIDIKGSSQARNIAVRKDLELQLSHVEKIVSKVYAKEQLPIYEQLKFRVTNFLEDLEFNFQVDSERVVLSFLKSEIIPLFKHLSTKSEDLAVLVQEYYKLVDSGTGFVYKHRKDYDDSVTQINRSMAAILDKGQKDVQLMYPHYFERFKTDGVEHNMYIGESITKKNSFHKVYLYNLRLWQLQIMCEMENSYYKLKENLAVPLDVASMILVFNTPLSLRFRMDEKRFDVDGTYNARYEVIKKRVDKAHIKGTNERITQAGKISIIFSQKADENEYLKYIKFLQKKKHLDEEVEILELEELQGVTGLKAIRVSVLYTGGKKQAKEYYTYEDLIEQINE